MKAQIITNFCVENISFAVKCTSLFKNIPILSAQRRLSSCPTSFERLEFHLYAAHTQKVIFLKDLCAKFAQVLNVEKINQCTRRPHICARRGLRFLGARNQGEIGPVRIEFHTGRRRKVQARGARLHFLHDKAFLSSL
jgi:hypothetical protein